MKPPKQTPPVQGGLWWLGVDPTHHANVLRVHLCDAFHVQPVMQVLELNRVQCKYAAALVIHLLDLQLNAQSQGCDLIPQYRFVSELKC